MQIEMRLKLVDYKNSISLIICLFGQHLLLSQNFENIAYRGGAGLLPENSIPAFLNALDSNATILEIDVVISKDGEVVVSHEPFISSEYCLTDEGKELTVSDEQKLIIYSMDYSQVRKFDCGTKGRTDFEAQERVPVNKPLLGEVIRECERYLKNYTQYEVDYLIELRSSEEGDAIDHPLPAEFSDRVFEVIDAYLPLSRIIIQSFDFRILKYWNEKYPEVRLSALVESIKSDETVLEKLGFHPHFYSPHYKLIRKRTIRDLHELGIKVYPWTVNEEKDMEKMMRWEVDGIITDYPNILNRLILESSTN